MLTLPYTSHKKAQPSCVWEGQAVMTSSAILFEAYPQDIICTNIHSFLMYRQEVMALPPAIHGIRHNGGGSWGSESLETNKWTPLSLTQEFCSGFNIVHVCVFSKGHSPSLPSRQCFIQLCPQTQTPRTMLFETPPPSPVGSKVIHFVMHQCSQERIRTGN